MSRLVQSWFLVGFFSAFVVVMVLGSIAAQELIRPGAFSWTAVAAAVAFHYRWVPEAFTMALVGLWLTSLGRSRWLFYVLVCAYLAVSSVQLLSLYLSQDFISMLALDNIGHVHLLLNAQTLGAVGGFLAIFVGFVTVCERLSRQASPTWRQNLAFSAILVILGGLALRPELLPQQVLTARDALFQARMAGPVAPVSAFAHVLVRRRTYAQTGSVEIQGYPLLKNAIHPGTPPFARHEADTTPQNVIVFFSEGLSTRVIGAPHLPKLTPQIDQFAQHPDVMVVKNYYNHTAATYRGLLGQLCSVFPKYGGYDGWDKGESRLPQMTYLCLPHIFHRRRYETVFLDCHHAEYANIDELMAKAGYGKIYNAEEMSREFLGGEKSWVDMTLSDHQLMRSLVGFLQTRAASQPQQPLFLGLYNLGTHANWKVATDGKKYGDGTNNALNTIHTYDDAFGTFWRWFQTSEYAQNTVVVFTADHAAYPAPGLLAVATPDYQRYFVDSIPLMIYDPSRRRPKTFDGDYSTSVDFAPSLLHYLDFPNHRHPFQGSSIFDPERMATGALGIASYGDEYYVIDREKIHYEAAGGPHAAKFPGIKQTIGFQQQVEVSNRLWRREWDEHYVEAPSAAK